MKTFYGKVNEQITRGYEYAFEVNALGDELKRIPLPTTMVGDRAYYDRVPFDSREHLKASHYAERKRVSADIARISDFVGILIGPDTIGGDVLQREAMLRNPHPVQNTNV